VTVSGTTRDSGCGARSRVSAQRGGVRAVRVSIARRQRGGCVFLLYAKGTDLAGNSERYDHRRRNGAELTVR
jgi:hypothetical protein